MKKKKVTMMLAAMLFVSMGAYAQSENAVEGDVNGDGKVDVADIVKVIDIMQNGGGTNSFEPTYYWFVDQAMPTNLSNPNAQDGQVGWHYIGDATALSEYQYDSTLDECKIIRDQEINWYVGLPIDTNVKMYDTQDVEATWGEYVNTSEFNGVTYKFYNYGATRYSIVR